MVDEDTFDWTDVRLAAWIFGDWARLERQVRAGLAGLCFLEADERPLDDETVEGSADDFRQERNLIAAEEMNAWLDARGITVDEWLGFLARALARRRLAGSLETVVIDYPVPGDAIAAARECEAICSGLATESARKLAAAAVFAAQEPASAAAPAGVAAAFDGVDLTAFVGIDRTTVETRRPRLAQLVHAFEALHAAAATETRVTRAIGAHGLDWMTLVCRTASFASEDTAREVALCVRDEGRDLAEVATAAGTRAQEVTLLLEELDPETQLALRSAEEGTLVGPLVHAGRLTLVAVDRKIVPDARDPGQRARASTWLREAAIAHHAARARFLMEL